MSGINNVVKTSLPAALIPESRNESHVQIPVPLPRLTTTQIVPKTQTLFKNIIFKVKADIQNDIYHLYCMENNKEIFYNVAYIPDYKTSVMMNKLFRNIKENDNLDLLEESDDEEEFQNENIDKFVDMNKSHLMICKFNHKFKKWYPVKDFSNQNPLIVDKKDLNDCENNNNKTYNNAPRQYQHQNQTKRPFHAQNRNQKSSYVK